MANPSAGFALSTLPSPLSMPQNIGVFDVSQGQQAYSNALKNVQQTALLKSQTEAAQAQNQYEAGKAKQLMNLLDPEEQAVLANFKAKRAAANVEEQTALGKTPYAKQIAEMQSIAEQNRSEAASRNQLGLALGSYEMGGMKIPYSVGTDGKVTSFAPSSLATTYLKGHVEDARPFASGNPINVGGTLYQGYIYKSRNPVLNTEHEISNLKHYAPVGKAPASFSDLMSGNNPYYQPTTEEINAAGGGQPISKSQEIIKSMADPKNPVAVEWMQQPVNSDNRNAKFLKDVAQRSVKNESANYIPSKEESSDLRKLVSENTKSANLFSQRAIALNLVAEAFQKYGESALPDNPIRGFIPSSILAILGIDEDATVDKALVQLVNATAGAIPNLRAYQGIKDLVAGSKPDRKLPASTNANIIREMAMGLDVAQEMILGMNWAATNLNVPAAQIEEAAMRNYSIRTDPSLAKTGTITPPPAAKTTTTSANDAASQLEALRAEKQRRAAAAANAAKPKE